MPTTSAPTSPKTRTWDALQVGALPESVQVEVFDPASSTWAAGADLDKPRDHPGVVVLPDGRVLVVGGVNEGKDANDAGGMSGHQSFSSGRLLDAKGTHWDDIALMDKARTDPAIAVLPDGRVLVAGGLYEDWYKAWFSGAMSTAPSA